MDHMQELSSNGCYDLTLVWLLYKIFLLMVFYKTTRI